MRINFNDGGYVEFVQVRDKYSLTIAVPTNVREKIINSAELDHEQAIQLFSVIKKSNKKQVEDASQVNIENLENE